MRYLAGGSLFLLGVGAWAVYGQRFEYRLWRTVDYLLGWWLDRRMR